MTLFHIKNNEVIVDKEVNALDTFTLDVIALVKKHVEYVIISGYVSIFFGRARATEDVDIFIKDLPFEAFDNLYEDAVAAGYEWVVDDSRKLYFEYLKQNTPISIWQKGFPLLRVEMKIATKPGQLMQFRDRITVKFKGYELFMASIEGQIAYKRYIAKSDKDLADALHLERVFDGLDPIKIAQYKRIFEEEFHARNTHIPR